MKSKYNWEEIQKDYDLNFLSKSELKEKYGFGGRSLDLAVVRGDFKFRDGKGTKQLKKSGQITPEGFKWCNNCKINLPCEEFNKKHGKKLQPFCKECNKVHSRNYYKINQKHHIEQIKIRNKKYTENIRDKIWKLICESGCLNCGTKNPLVLEFDHLDRTTKENDVGRLLVESNSWSKVKKEIDKCQILCSNCHRIKTHEENNSWRWKKYKEIF